MKRSIDASEIYKVLEDNNEPNTKGGSTTVERKTLLKYECFKNGHNLVLVEREEHPGGVSLVNPMYAGKSSYTDVLELSGASNVNNFIQVSAKNKLDIIGKQMKNLHNLMTDVLDDTKLSTELHNNVACNFVKKPGHVYHLYERPSGQKYFGMLSPEEWQISPHNYLGSFLLEADLTWTPAQSYNGKYEGISFLKQLLQM